MSLLLATVGGSSAPTFGGVAATSGYAASFNVTLTGVPSGATIVVFSAGQVAPTTVTDNIGSTYSVATSGNSSGIYFSQINVATSVTGGTVTVTNNFSSAAGLQLIAAWFSASTVSGSGVTTDSAFPGTGANVATASVTPAASNTLLVAFDVLASYNSGGLSAGTSPISWTGVTLPTSTYVNPQTVAMEYATLGSGTGGVAQTVSFGNTVNLDNLLSAIALVGSGGGGGGTPTTTIAIAGQSITASFGSINPSLGVGLPGTVAVLAVGLLPAGAGYAVSGLATALSLTQGDTPMIAGEIAALTGISTTLTVGAVSAQVGYSVSGLGATLSAGAVLGNPGNSLTGIGLTGTPGALGAAVGSVLTGINSTLTQGSLPPSVGTGITGIGLTGSQGTVLTSGGYVYALTGQAVALTPGSVGVEIDAAALGLGLTGTAGSLGGNPTFGLGGQGLAAAAGAVSGSSSIGLNGAAALVTAGSVSPSVSGSVSGVVATLTAGSIAGGAAFALPGMGMTGAAGALAPGIAVSPAGQGATIAQGAVIASEGVVIALTGIGLVLTPGTITSPQTASSGSISFPLSPMAKVGGFMSIQ